MGGNILARGGARGGTEKSKSKFAAAAAPASAASTPDKAAALASSHSPSSAASVSPPQTAATASNILLQRGIKRGKVALDEGGVAVTASIEREADAAKAAEAADVPIPAATDAAGAVILAGDAKRARGNQQQQVQQVGGVVTASSPPTASGGKPVVPWGELTEVQRAQVETWRRSKLDRHIIKEIVSSHAASLVARSAAGGATSSDPVRSRRVGGPGGNGGGPATALSSAMGGNSNLDDARRRFAPAIRETSLITVCALAKLFIGDLVEGARESMKAAGLAVDQAGDEKGNGGERPQIGVEHYLEAWRRMSESGSLPGMSDSGVSALAGTPNFKFRHSDII